MVQYCCVPGCTSKAGKETGISFHALPKNEKVRKEWVIKIKRDEKLSKVSEKMRVCSLHFLPSDYTPGELKIKRLRKDAVPSVFSFTPAPKNRRLLVRSPVCESKNIQDQHLDCAAETPEPEESGTTLQREETVVIRDETIVDREERFVDGGEIAALKEEIEALKKTIQDLKKGRLLHPQFTMSIVKEKLDVLTYYTGFDSKDMFNCMYEYLTACESISFSKKVKIEDQILLVLAKLRQNFDFFDLAFRFNITHKLAAFIFNKWVNVLYCRLGSLCIWPNRERILQQAPLSFKTNYPNTVLLLDATEMKIECPSSLVLQSQSYSNYKSTNTLKGLVACDPNGAVVFISQLFMGNISDKKIFHESGFYGLLKQKLDKGDLLPGDSVMVDKGFSIKEDLESLGLHVNVPPIASAQQFEKNDVQKTRKIASSRVHVERAMRRIKCFKILKQTVSVHTLPHINQIWTVCGLLSNIRVCIKK